MEKEQNPKQKFPMPYMLGLAFDPEKPDHISINAVANNQYSYSLQSVSDEDLNYFMSMVLTAQVVLSNESFRRHPETLKDFETWSENHRLDPDELCPRVNVTNQQTEKK